jgi:septum formation protein
MTHLILASRSPRRLRLLEEAGFSPRPRPADLDDADLRPTSVPPAFWVAGLAYLKAARVALTIADELEPGATVLGADTVVVKDGRIIGQPKDAQHARETILTLARGSHDVLTGVALLSTGRPRTLLVDTARVEVGEIPAREIDEYVDSGEWRGKAGAYNLADRQAAGWPVRTTGDPGTVMGLPMRRLGPALRRLSFGERATDIKQVASPESTP